MSAGQFLARHFADQHDFELACRTALHHLPQPNIPQIPSSLPLDEMKARFDRHPDDLAEGLMLCQAQMQNNRIDDALTTVMTLEKLKNPPPYIFTLRPRFVLKISSGNKLGMRCCNMAEFNLRGIPYGPF